ncbi:hypothetical protein [Fulvivirga lutimaris]|uniref:hypothetical protein n=1 Tax=Fulvivirga lutimaris TaxID=1819566 RepID=UPI0012BD1BC2|nr:hypothetical protein [Fulvivirga lutimaris]MTI39796.1 hypothetical protein [Fulvivirga lutimaris]
MRFSIYIILLFILSPAVYAQDWLVTTSADTLHGEIAIELPMERYEELTIKNDDSKQRFKAYQVIEFEHKGQKYKTVKHAGVYRIMLVDSDGYLSQFRFRADQGYEFASVFLLKTDGESLEVSNLTFKKSLAKFLEDCETVVDDLENKKYKRSDLDQIVADYNSCINEKTANKLTSETTSETSTSVSHPGIPIIESILKKIDTTSDLSAMLNDIKSKLSKGENVAGYLKSALKEQAAGQENIKEEVDQLLETIK